MQQLWYFLTDRRTLVFIGFIALAIYVYVGADDLENTAVNAAVLLAAALATAFMIWLLINLYQYWQKKLTSQPLGEVLEKQRHKALAQTSAMKHSDVEAVRKRMADAVQTIKSSKLGYSSKKSAVYELPWYMIIGNPAAGKSTAINNSGLQFPFSDKSGKPIHGIGGTRNCDWFFTAEGILLDTAGRYTAHEEDSEEWFGFLALLKKHRKLAPINGILIAVSITELVSNNAEFAVNLAKTFRERIQELTEKLEITAPVYIIFTKADTLAGFNEFFLDTEPAEKDRVWGATIPFSLQQTSKDILDFFDRCFDELYEGLKQISLTKMALRQGVNSKPGVFTFPLEFLATKNPLLIFISTLFEDNPYQFKPLFRGFYFTSALQETNPGSSSSERIANRFNLNLRYPEHRDTVSGQGLFLKDLFRKVIFADKNLVRQFTSRSKLRLRYAAFFAAATLLGLSLAAWSWSYINNQQLTENVQADLNKIVRLQDAQSDLKSRFEALEVLQERLAQLEKYRDERPWSLGFGLYQGDILEQKLRAEYYLGIKEVMLKPISASLENFLTEVNANADRLQPMTSLPASGAVRTAANAKAAQALTSGSVQIYKDLAPNNVEDAYNALKTYLMLGERSRSESGHLNDQLTRFWRFWLDANRGLLSRDEMIQSAESIISFYLAHSEDPSWPVIENKLSLIDQVRENLRRVVKGMPARDRIYADVKARASTRFPAMTVAGILGDQDNKLIGGSYAIPGAFTKAAWENFVADAFQNVANKELQSTDWVLKTSSKDDLTLEGSPEQIQKSLTDLYKAEYSKEWQKFLQGIVVSNFNGFDSAVSALNRLGDPQSSPVNTLIKTVYNETSWDNPSLVDEGMQRAQRGFIEWFKQSILRQKPSHIDVKLNTSTSGYDIPMGPVGRDFAGIAKIVVAKSNNASLMNGYMENLSRLRSRFNQLKNQGDPGPGAKLLMQQTLDSSGSELVDTLRFVDEQMLVGMIDSQKQILRPLLVRPLMQGFEVIVQPTAFEMNKIWQAQIYTPFQNTLAKKYPFAANSRIEAGSMEIGQLFGSDGAIAKFFSNDMGPLVVRRGNTLSSKTWANIGLSLTPEIQRHFASWTTPLSAGGVPSASATEDHWVFQLLPYAAPGTIEYTIEIDGQQLRYRNTQAQWMNLIWPHPQGVPGARISVTTFDGQAVDILNFPGRFGFKRLIDAAVNKRKAGGLFELTWSGNGVSVTADLKIISRADGSGDSTSPQDTGFKGMKLPENVINASPISENTALFGGIR